MLKPDDSSDFTWDVTKRQSIVVAVFGLLFLAFVTVLYLLDRHSEWRLRIQQAEHRLNLANEMMSRELTRVRSDALFLAQMDITRRFASGETELRDELAKEYAQFVSQMQNYDQVRLLDMQGTEVVRVNATRQGVSVTPVNELQDKKERYYFRQSLNLKPFEIFVSDFDLNQEYGEIERPLNPVIRFVTPVVNESEQVSKLLVINYLGGPLLDELRAISLPGQTLIVKTDGQYLLGPTADDAWGWLLGHQRSFDNDFPEIWRPVLSNEKQQALTKNGLFKWQPISLSKSIEEELPKPKVGSRQVKVISRLPRSEVFALSDQLLQRLLFVGAIMLLPLVLLTRFWAVAVSRRHQQNLKIARSEEKLRELSARLLRVQEEERKLISREIHDELGQQVTAINLDLKLAEREQQSESARQQLTRAIKENEQLLSTLHDFARRVRPAVLDDLGLLDAVESYVWEYENRTGIQVEFEMDSREHELPDAVEDNVYRLLQESLNNVVKHADADQVRVTMKIRDLNDGSVFEMIVADNGKGGVRQNAESDRLGLIGMQERVDLLGGTFQINSDEHGTTLETAIPLK